MSLAVLPDDVQRLAFCIARCELLEKLWRKKVALSSESLLTAILNDEVLSKIRTVLLRERGCPLTNQEIQEAIERELLR